MKSKLGVSIGLLGALVYCLACFGGYVATIIAVGYILLFEENEWLKKSAVKAIAIAICFSFCREVISLIPSALDWLGSLVSIFSGLFSYSIVSTVVSVINKTLTIVETVVLLILAVKALNQGSVDVPFIDKLIDKE